MNDQLFDHFSDYERRLLAQRATELATAATALNGESHTLEALTFYLGDERYALAASSIREVRPLDRYTPVPCTPDHIMGVINMHGDILPLVDIRPFLGITSTGLTDLMFVIVVQGNVGLLAQSIGEVNQFTDDHFEAPTINVQGIRVDYIQGMAHDGLILLDLPRILGDKRIIVND